MQPLEAITGLVLTGTGITAAVVASQRRHSGSGVLAYLKEVGEGEHSGAAQSLEEDKEPDIVERLLRPAVAGIAARGRTLFPSSYLDRVHVQILAAGLGNRIRAEEFVTAQAAIAGAGLLLGAVFATLSSASATMRVLVLLLLLAISGMGPKAWLSGRADRRRKLIDRQLPDVLDLLTISVEAGLGLEGAFESVCQDLHTPLGQEMQRMLHEMNLGLSRARALENMKDRVNVENLTTFILVLSQADTLGMPIGRVLRIQSDQMRERRRAKAREKAAKLPVKILFPLMVFILPPLMIVVLGPAAMGIVHTFSHHAS